MPLLCLTTWNLKQIHEALLLLEFCPIGNVSPSKIRPDSRFCIHGISDGVSEGKNGAAPRCSSLSASATLLAQTQQDSNIKLSDQIRRRKILPRLESSRSTVFSSCSDSTANALSPSRVTVFCFFFPLKSFEAPQSSGAPLGSCSGHGLR